MKGFIELHEVITGDRSLIGIGNVACVADCHNEGTLIQFPTSQIGVRESYEEVKALIAEAQREADLKDYIPKKKLEKWMESQKKKSESGEPFDAYLFNMLSVFIADLNMFLEKEEQ